MARSNAAWGIEIGQCALKALRCRAGDEPGQLVADAFDYIEYPKILSQPEANPAELIKEALEQFLSRNSVRGDRVAIAVPGQSGLARFIKLPPVEAKKIPDIVRYEAKQQIPFALEDVVWDYQRMAGGSVEEGFALETEVGLFAMKREQVQRALKPLDDAGIEVDVVQLTPLALYNFATFDQFPDLPNVEDYDPDNPPASLVMVSLGTDTTDLVVTNGFRVWQRSIPIGGNHFTKALTKELKLTFAKAEHLKRNAAAAEDPKAVFQAMRPEFNNLLTEVQRSIGYFSNLDRTAKIGRVIGLGNAMKLPGLQSYLGKNLGQELGRVDAFRNLAGPTVVNAPAFKENVLSFPVCYGLCVQALRESKISTNLLPREILQDRLVRDKQPWAVATAAAILLGLLISCLGYWRSWNSARLTDFESAMGSAQGVARQSSDIVKKYDDASKDLEAVKALGDKVALAGKNRTEWAEFWHAFNLALPRDPEGQEPPENLAERNQLYVTEVRCKRVENLAEWFQNVQPYYKKVELPKPPEEQAAVEGEAGAEGEKKPEEPKPAEPPAGGPRGGGNRRNPRGGGNQQAAPAVEGPTGPGWVVRVTGFHFHNSDPMNRGDLYVRNTFFQNLVKQAADAEAAALAQAGLQPGGAQSNGGDGSGRGDGDGGGGGRRQGGGQGKPAAAIQLPVAASLGFPVLVNPGSINSEFVLKTNADDAEGKKLPRFDFEINFCWKDTSPPVASSGGGGGGSGSGGRGGARSGRGPRGGG